MFVYAFIVLTLLFFGNGAVQFVTSQSISWTPVVRSGLQRAVIDVHPAFSSVNIVPGTHDVYIPQGWTASIFYAGTELRKPRFLAWGPDSVLYVANMNGNTILALPDANRDGVADQAVVAATVPAYTSSIVFYRDTMFVGSESGITKRWRSSGGGYVFDQMAVVVDKTSQQGQTGGNHRTRTVAVDTVNYKIYLSGGSRGNADREPLRALIERYDWDGSNRTIYAHGIRNAVGLTVHPRTGRLWAANNGSDLQGNNIPPEWVDIIRENGFYGYPFAYHDKNVFNLEHSDYRDILPLTSTDSTLLESMVPAAALITAHCAPMQLAFAHSGMPTEFQNGVFLAQRGSWNRSPISGSKVVFLSFDNDADTIANAEIDFCTNFVIDSLNNASRWARPVGIAVSADGSVYVSSDDLKQFILKLTPPRSTSVLTTKDVEQNVNIIPNPASDVVTIAFEQHSEASIRFINELGQTVKEIAHGAERQIDVTGLPSGIYTVLVTTRQRSFHCPLHIVR